MTTNLKFKIKKNLCPCCSGKLYEECCELFHSKKISKNCGRTYAFSLSAFAIPNGDYLWETTLPNKRKFHHKKNWKTGEKKTLGRN
jgi:SEC-C motif-containing protein